MLPEIKYSLYTFTIPSSGEVIQFRPYTVGEEKILLTALESDDFNNIVSAMQTVLTNCTMGKVDVTKLATYDVELLFLNIREQSAGEKLKLSLVNNRCQKKNGESPCDKPSDIAINIKEVGVMWKKNDEFVKVDPVDIRRNKKVMITDRIGIQFRHPNFTDLKGGKDLFDPEDDSLTEVEKVKKLKKIGDELAYSCVEAIFDGDHLVRASECTPEQIKTWMDALDPQSKAKIDDFFNNLPELRHVVKFKCRHCEFKTDYVLEGIRAFFD